MTEWCENGVFEEKKSPNVNYYSSKMIWDENKCRCIEKWGLYLFVDVILSRFSSRFRNKLSITFLQADIYTIYKYRHNAWLFCYRILLKSTSQPVLGQYLRPIHIFIYIVLFTILCTILFIIIHLWNFTKLSFLHDCNVTSGYMSNIEG